MIESNSNFRMFVPTTILFGPGLLGNLHMQALPGSKALVVISNGTSTKTNGYLARVENELRMAEVDYSIFDKVEPNPLKVCRTFQTLKRLEYSASRCQQTTRT